MATVYPAYPAYPAGTVLVTAAQPQQMSGFLDLRGSKEFDAPLCSCCQDCKVCMHTVSLSL